MAGHGNGFKGTNFRFRLDTDLQDPEPSPPDWMAAINTNIEIPLDFSKFRLRFALEHTGNGGDFQCHLQSSLNSGAYTKILDDGSTILTTIISDVVGVDNNEDIVPYTGANQIYTLTFADTSNGYMITDDSESETEIANWINNSGLPLEACLQLEPSLLSGGDIIDIRMFLGLGAPPTQGWDNTARITIESEPGHGYLPVMPRQRALSPMLTR